MSVGLYIHIPFCHARCHFCAFYLEMYRDERAQAYLDSLTLEIQLSAQEERLGQRRLDTVYFGGGTPTTLRANQLCGVLNRITQQFGLNAHAEVSLEAHPDTVHAESLHALREAGFTRISFGFQSMDAEELIHLGRPTLPHTMCRAVGLARAAGFDDINLDLMYGLPGQTLKSWRATVASALTLRPTHVSCYALTLEEGTRLHRDVRRGDQQEPDTGLQNEMEDDAIDLLTRSGFQRYEISNFCLPGHACRHNLLYWQGQDYLGLGPSAQSYVHGDRFGNAENLAAYHDALASGRLPVLEHEHLSEEQSRREAVVFGLRLLDGVSIGTLDAAGHGDWEKTITSLMGRGLVEHQSGRLRLTKVGRRFADSVAVELLV